MIKVINESPRKVVVELLVLMMLLQGVHCLIHVSRACCCSCLNLIAIYCLLLSLPTSVRYHVLLLIQGGLEFPIHHFAVACGVLAERSRQSTNRVAVGLLMLSVSRLELYVLWGIQSIVS